MGGLELLEVGAFDAANAHDHGPELVVALLHFIDCLDDLDEVLVGLLGEDEDDGGAGFAVELADVAERGAGLFAGERLDLERAGDLLVWAGLQVVRVDAREREAEGDGESRDDHRTHCQSSSVGRSKVNGREEAPPDPIGLGQPYGRTAPDSTFWCTASG